MYTGYPVNNYNQRNTVKLKIHLQGWGTNCPSSELQPRHQLLLDPACCEGAWSAQFSNVKNLCLSTCLSDVTVNFYWNAKTPCCLTACRLCCGKFPLTKLYCCVRYSGTAEEDKPCSELSQHACAYPSPDLNLLRAGHKFMRSQKLPSWILGMHLQDLARTSEWNAAESQDRNK